MPVQYAGILEEHRAVRERAGLFDLSHMGELFVEGPEAGAALAAALVTDPPTLDGRPGPLLDDLRARRRGHRRPDRLSARERALPRRRQRRQRRRSSPTRSPSGWPGCRAVLDDRSLATALVAIQGPRAAEILAPLHDVDLGALRYYAIAEGPGRPASRRSSPGPATPARTASRSSSTPPRTVELWDALLAGGRDAEAAPVGLGARDTLRLEAGMPLYGNELDRRHDPATTPGSAAS